MDNLFSQVVKCFEISCTKIAIGYIGTNIIWCHILYITYISNMLWVIIPTQDIISHGRVIEC